MTIAKSLSPVQINVIEYDEGRTLREQLTHDNNRYVPGELPCKFGLNYHQSLKTPYRLKADPHSQLSCAGLPFHPPPPAFTAACKAAGEQHPDRFLIMSWMQPAPLPAQNVIRACFRLLLSLKPGCGKELLACMAGVEGSWSAWTSLTEGIDDVLSIVLQQRRSSNANKITDNQFLSRHKHHLLLLMPSDDLDKVPTCPAGRFTLLADSVGRLVASSRLGTLLFVPCTQEILIETVDRHTKDAIAELYKRSSMLTQDSVNQQSEK